MGLVVLVSFYSCNFHLVNYIEFPFPRFDRLAEIQAF